MRWKAEKHTFQVWKNGFGFRSFFVTQNGIYQPHNANLSNFIPKKWKYIGFSGIVFVIDQAQYMFTRIKSHGLSKEEQVESSIINLTLLNPKGYVNRQQYIYFAYESQYMFVY